MPPNAHQHQRRFRVKIEQPAVDAEAMAHAGRVRASGPQAAGRRRFPALSRDVADGDARPFRRATAAIMSTVACGIE
jgi:hypothetical protein